MSAERLDYLWSRWSEGLLSEEESSELENALRLDTAARRRFRRHANLDSALRGWAGGRAEGGAWKAPAPSPTRLPGARSIWQAGWKVVAAAAAVTLLAGVCFMALGRNRSREAAPEAASPQESTAQGCAVLAQTLDAKFAGPPSTAGATLPVGRVHLASGFAQIEFFSGASLVLEGEAEIELVSSWEARCLSGKVRARVPPAARGFRLHAPGVRLVDLGTEFAVNVDRARADSDVHVFTGEVIAHPEGGAELSLREGQSLHGRTPAALDPSLFLGVGQLHDLVSARESERFLAWKAWSEASRQDARLIAYFPIQHRAQWERLVENAAEPVDHLKNGGAVGVTWTSGRWPQKDALQFRRPGDRVRLQIPGFFSALTFACWARIDSLDRRYNALLLTDGYDPGAPHWQIYEDGRLMFSVAYPKPGQTESANRKNRQNQIYYSPVVFTPATMGSWHHLAVTYENQSGEAVQYFDGAKVSREISPFHLSGRPLQIGPCKLGNWGLPIEGHQFPIRNLNGALDEFAIYSAQLSEEEIKRLYEHGKPE